MTAKNITITILSLHGLNIDGSSKADIACRIYGTGWGDKPKQTKTIKKTLDAKFDDEFELPVVDLTSDKVKFEIINTAVDNKVLSSITIALVPDIPPGDGEKDFKLQPSSGVKEGGTLRIGYYGDEDQSSDHRGGIFHQGVDESASSVMTRPPPRIEPPTQVKSPVKGAPANDDDYESYEYSSDSHPAKPGAKQDDDYYTEYSSTAASKPAAKPAAKQDDGDYSYYSDTAASKPGAKPAAKQDDGDYSYYSDTAASKPGSKPAAKQEDDYYTEYSSAAPSKPGAKPAAKQDDGDYSYYSDTAASKPGAKPAAKQEDDYYTEYSSAAPSKPGAKPAAKQDGGDYSYYSDTAASKPAAKQDGGDYSYYSDTAASKPGAKPAAKQEDDYYTEYSSTAPPANAPPPASQQNAENPQYSSTEPESQPGSKPAVKPQQRNYDSQYSSEPPKPSVPPQQILPAEQQDTLDDDEEFKGTFQARNDEPNQSSSGEEEDAKTNENLPPEPKRSRTVEERNLRMSQAKCKEQIKNIGMDPDQISKLATYKVMLDTNRNLIAQYQKELASSKTGRVSKLLHMQLNQQTERLTKALEELIKENAMNEANQPNAEFKRSRRRQDRR